MLFHQTTFGFSQPALDWITNYYKDKYETNFHHNLDGIQWRHQDIWHASPAGIELLNFLKQYYCNTENLIITAHLSNTKNSGFTNPHVDVINRGAAEPKIIKSRFNVLVKGNVEDAMYWWPNIACGDHRLIPAVHTSSRTGKPYNTFTVPGDTIKEKFIFLGKADVIKSNLLTPSAFVRTDCMHTIFTSAGPRLVVTVEFDETIEELLNIDN
jgi:hypothetical protein